jgi:hypothetical protein
MNRSGIEEQNSLFGTGKRETTMSTAGKQTKQPLSVYSVMLVLSAILMLAASILMAIELMRYGSPWESPGIPASMIVLPSLWSS